MTLYDLLFTTPAAVLRIDRVLVVWFWKHEASLNTTAEIQATDYVDLGQDNSRGGGNMLSDAEFILNINPVRYPNTLDVRYKWKMAVKQDF